MKYLILLCPLLLTACATPTATPAEPIATDIAEPDSSTLPKLAMPTKHCTMEYMPVCATLEQNGQQFTKTFGNRCSAHSFIDEGVTVVDVRDGDCDPSKQALMRFGR
ncbi:hypothetical protein LP123_03790 [Moraxella bovis]|uniref:Kazal-like domain-containing protein n=1 Tax=Moraxella bovis TaxID=476 RepID=A0AAQ2T1Z7_MORBO|nr:hypothetical protein [Moraxella bovis]AWY19704.1 hypothetical protein DQF64_03785 [Moraxella bovis]OOR92004.1 hypothetical protein B0182_02195 [Moraxella bovis]UYZ75174.1 hypothetical protein LP093_10455 [Moraxella bovis]UYZ78894.1 hypothetical protein LP115_03395 [Moraxella bovis]UYZ80519.1 hypothetical protein LP113_10820 [Moraxella bovis]